MRSVKEGEKEREERDDGGGGRKMKERGYVSPIK